MSPSNERTAFNPVNIFYFGSARLCEVDTLLIFCFLFFKKRNMNQLIADYFKPWLNARVNDLQIDGQLTGGNVEATSLASTGEVGFLHDDSVSVNRKSIVLADLQSAGSGAPDNTYLQHDAGVVSFAPSPVPKSAMWEASVINTVPNGYRLIFLDEKFNNTDLSFDVLGEELSGFQAGKLYKLEFKTNIKNLGAGDAYSLGIAENSGVTFLDQYDQSIVGPGMNSETVYLQLLLNGDDLVGDYLEFRFDSVAGTFDAEHTSLIVTQTFG